MDNFIDTTKMEKLRKILIVIDVLLILIVIISYVLSGFKVGGLLGYISSQTIGGDDERPYAFIFLLFVGILLTIIVSLQLLVIQAIITMVNHAYQYPLSNSEKEKKVKGDNNNEDFF